MICYFFIGFKSSAKQSKAKQSITMFCKVCFDASKSDYKTHNVKDSASNVVCPLLLNTKCRKCGYFGHTTKYCKFTENPVVQKAYARPACVAKVPVAKVPVAKVPVAKVPVAKVPVAKVPVSAYACLVGLDEEDDICQESSPNGVEELDFDKEEIIWGVGFKSMIGKRWADVVGC